MRKNDFRDAAVDLSYEMGAQHKIDGDEIIWWFEENKKERTKIPPHGGDFRSVENFKSRLKRTMEAAKPAHFALQNQTKEEKDKWTAYLDKRLQEIRAEFEAKLEKINGEVAASTDIALDSGLKVDNFVKAFGSVFNQVSGQPTTPPVATPAPTIAKPPVAPVTQALPVPKAAPGGGPIKSLAALGELSSHEVVKVKKPNARALVAARNLKLTPEMRVLRFLDELKGAASVDEMRRAGLVGDDGQPRSLEALLAEMDLARGLLVFDEDTDTYDLSERAEDLLNEADEVAHQAKSEPVARQSALEKIEEGLTEALAFARGEPNHAKTVHVPAEQSAPSSAISSRQPAMPAAYSGSPVFSAEAQKPTLTVVPSQPKILKPISTFDVSQAKLTYIEKAMVALLKKDMTIEELQRTIGHRSSPKSLASMLYKCERENGYIQYFFAQDKVYRITEKGRAYIRRIPSNYTGQTLAAS